MSPTYKLPVTFSIMYDNNARLRFAYNRNMLVMLVIGNNYIQAISAFKSQIFEAVLKNILVEIKIVLKKV